MVAVARAATTPTCGPEGQTGDPTEIALLELRAELGVDTARPRRSAACRRVPLRPDAAPDVHARPRRRRSLHPCQGRAGGAPGPLHARSRRRRPDPRSTDARPGAIRRRRRPLRRGRVCACSASPNDLSATVRHPDAGAAPSATSPSSGLVAHVRPATAGGARRRRQLPRGRHPDHRRHRRPRPAPPPSIAHARRHRRRDTRGRHRCRARRDERDRARRRCSSRTRADLRPQLTGGEAAHRRRAARPGQGRRDDRRRRQRRAGAAARRHRRGDGPIGHRRRPRGRDDGAHRRQLRHHRRRGRSRAAGSTTTSASSSSTSSPTPLPRSCRSSSIALSGGRIPAPADGAADPRDRPRHRDPAGARARPRAGRARAHGPAAATARPERHRRPDAAARLGAARRRLRRAGVAAFFFTLRPGRLAPGRDVTGPARRSTTRGSRPPP